MNRPERARPNEMRGLVHLARKQLLRSAHTAYDALALDRLMLAQRRALAARRRTPYIWGSAGVVAAAALGWLLVGTTLSHHGRDLTYTARPASARQNEPKTERYQFSDGTVISLRDGAELQVLSRDGQGARVKLTRGEAHVNVVHRENSRWNFVAGPFDVAVVGTAFDLSWDPQRQAFSLDLQEGVVKVSGPVLDGPLRLYAGHRVSIFVQTNRVALDTALPESSADRAASAELPRPAVPLPGPLPQAMPSSISAQSPARNSAGSDIPNATSSLRQMSWHALVGRGRFAEVVSQAQAMPIDGCLAHCSATDLRALGDAARYSGRAALAERALLGLRRRFPGSPDSSVAAFLLARTYEAQHRPQLAQTWYDRYLNESPLGEFSVEATAGRARVSDSR